MHKPARFRCLPLLLLPVLAPVWLPAAPPPQAQEFLSAIAPSAALPAVELPVTALNPAPAAVGAAQRAVAASAPTATPEEIGDSLEAHQHYQAALAAYAQDPHRNAAVWNKMGIAYQMMFNLKAAARCYKESLRLKPKSAMVLNNLGTVYDSVKDYSAAERMYHKALKVDPKSPLILKNLGTNLLVQRKYNKGWQAYEKALALDPNIFENHTGPTVANPTSLQERGAMNYFMARGCVRMGQTECALDYLRRALDEGYTTAKKISSDADFASLRDNPAFKQLLAEQQQQQHP